MVCPWNWTVKEGTRICATTVVVLYPMCAPSPFSSCTWDVTSSAGSRMLLIISIAVRYHLRQSQAKFGQSWHTSEIHVSADPQMLDTPQADKVPPSVKPWGSQVLDNPNHHPQLPWATMTPQPPLWSPVSKAWYWMPRTDFPDMASKEWNRERC